MWLLAWTYCSLATSFSVPRALLSTSARRVSSSSSALFVSKAGWVAILKAANNPEESADEILEEIGKLEEACSNLEKDKDDLRKDKIKLEASLARLQSKYTSSAETNLRPILEEFAASTWQRRHADEKLPTTQELLNKYTNANKMKIDECIALAKNLSKHMGPSFDVNKKSIKVEMGRVYQMLSEDMHIVKLPPECPIGFVVNQSPIFSLAMSVYLMCAKQKHTVLSNEYREKVYHWPYDAVRR